MFDKYSDIAACVTNTILFVRPLFALNKITGKDDDLKYLAIKQCVLSMIAIVSTIIALLIVAMFNLYVFSICMDFVVSSLCIILMYKWNGKCIEYLCLCCCHFMTLSDDVKNLDSVVNQNDNTTSVQPSTTDVSRV